MTERKYSVKEAAQFLIENGVITRKNSGNKKGTDIEVTGYKQVHKYIKSGELNATLLNRKSGYVISEKDLIAFASTKNKVITKINNLESELNELKIETKKQDTMEKPKEKSIELSGIEKEVEDYIKERPFETLTKGDYERLIFTLSANFSDLMKTKKEKEELNKELTKYRSIVEENKTDPLERKVIKGLGVSISTIVKNTKKHQEDVYRVELAKVDSREIKAYFLYNKEKYFGIIANSNVRDESDWCLKSMKKQDSTRQVLPQTKDKVEHSVIRQVFEEIYDLEQARNEEFHYFYDLTMKELNKRY